MLLKGRVNGLFAHDLGITGQSIEIIPFFRFVNATNGSLAVSAGVNRNRRFSLDFLNCFASNRTVKVENPVRDLLIDIKLPGVKRIQLIRVSRLPAWKSM